MVVVVPESNAERLEEGFEEIIGFQESVYGS
jgi:hypothetical protein